MEPMGEITVTPGVFKAVLTFSDMWPPTGSKVQGFKVAFSTLDCIWDVYLQKKRQLRQV
jgi:hypothetical protein